MQKSRDRVTFGGMAGCLLIIALMGVVFIFAIRSRNENVLEPKLLFFIENSSELSPEISVTIDESVIFEGEARPPPLGRRPAIIFSQRLDLPSGQHNIRFEDRTRGITEAKSFDSSTRTIFVHMQKWVNNGHIEFYRELIYPK
jgi:hypothetical protein